MVCHADFGADESQCHDLEKMMKMSQNWYVDRIDWFIDVLLVD